MIREMLNGRWAMRTGDGDPVEGTIPGSVYSFLLDAGRMKDPFFGDNELEALALMENDYTFFRTFRPSSALLLSHFQVLRFDGIDTLSDIYLNGRMLGSTDNMHRCWEFDAAGLLKDGENVLEVRIKSPTRFIRKEDEKHHLGGTTDAMKGFPHLRKAHCMFGWDWGPRLPDMGIWKDVTLLGWDRSRIEDLRIKQHHTLKDGTPAMGDPAHAAEAAAGKVKVEVTITVTQSGSLPVRITITSPSGQAWELENGMPFSVPEPQLWWPNGLGEQPLYTVRVQLVSGDDCADVRTCRIGLRTMTMRRRPDEWGESFATEVNGQTFFAMGADYIPEDCILSRITPETTRALLEDCAAAHFNAVRVWGGGFYPFDWFYDACDELGLVVWQDFMFACANYRITPEYVENISEEIRQNVRRIRHHASLGLWCGNNEMEQFALVKEFDGDEVTAADYLIQNEYIIAKIVSEEDPDAFYWPSSPSSGGKFVSPQDPDRGDVHYWDVWHGGVPFTAYRQYYFRYLSEFGFQSFPCLETVESFTDPEDRNIFSYVMEMHQRNVGANGKILQYLSATYRYPTDLEKLLYASQLLQAEAIRCGVEHFRRNRGSDRCMGAIYWQLNDNWPVASWASRDYYGRWKALHYYAARFFAPVMLSCEEESIVSQGRTCVSEPAPVNSTARLCLANETRDEVRDEVIWELRDENSRILESGQVPVCAAPFDCVWTDRLDFSAYDHRSVHLSYRLRERDSFGSVLFAPPKHYRFADPKLQLVYDEKSGSITVTAEAYAKSVEIWSPDGYIRLDDNYFDMEAGTRTVKLLEGAGKVLRARSVFDIK